MRYPIWRCQHCGERLFAHIEGDCQCLNCERRYASVELEGRAA